ncbi:hypothetical protein CV631_004406 [Escherichia coli]|uniref:primase C-terminal domain-containing protein n=2 Tax=Escherichia coli TaxID=562 RepID=UPI0017E633BF|nr:hypothetical protein [Escherichia coli]MBP2820772.1 primase C-terminal domain-containing protein [Escherichia coli]
MRFMYKIFRSSNCPPLDENEVMGIAKSVTKWTSTHFSKNSLDDFVRNTHSPELKSVRRGNGGKSGGLISRRGSIL